VDRVGAGVGGPLEDLLDGQVALGRALALQGVGLVGHRDVQCVEVGLRVHGDAGQARVLAGPDDAHGDLAAVGD
jgi:hypothetical protein